MKQKRDRLNDESRLSRFTTHVVLIHQDVRGDHSDPHEVPAGDSPMGEFQHRLR